MVNEAGRKDHHIPSPELLQYDVTRNRPARRSGSYVGKRNTQGLYWFEQTARHIWWDAMTEYTALMILDHTEDVAGICSQPMRIDFADGSSHFPDVFVRYRDGRQELCNVRPASLIDEATAAKFRTTDAVCAAIGWTHRIVEDLTLIQRNNLEWLASTRHPRNRPPASLAAELLDAATEPVRFGRLWAITRRSRYPYALAGLHNLMWQRALTFNTHQPLQFDTLIWRP